MPTIRYTVTVQLSKDQYDALVKLAAGHRTSVYAMAKRAIVLGLKLD